MKDRSKLFKWEYIEDFGRCEDCGKDLIEHKEYPTGEKQFLPVTYYICEDKNCSGGTI